MEASTSAQPLAGLVVFASGAGSNFRALASAVREGRLPARLLALVTNVVGSGAAVTARELGVLRDRDREQGAFEPR